MNCDAHSDYATWVSDGISLFNLLFTIGIFLAAVTGLAVWRSQVLGGRKVELAEECLHSAREFGFRIKLIRAKAGSPYHNEDVRRELKELVESYLNIQWRISRFNDYRTSRSNDDISVLKDVSKIFGKCLSMLKQSYNILERYKFEKPSPGDPSDNVAAIAVKGERVEEFNLAWDAFFGSENGDTILADLEKALAKLENCFGPILTLRKGWLGNIIDRVASAL